jgi:hypothetical protein
MLKIIHQNPEQGWVLLEQSVHGYDLPEWFEKHVCLYPSLQTFSSHLKFPEFI